MAWLQPLTIWLQAHPGFAITFAGMVAFIESFAIIGSIVPGSITITAIGVMIGAGIIPAAPTIIAAIIGAILGDAVSYILGRIYHDRMRQMWPFCAYPNLLTQGEIYFRLHGGKSIFLGRFVGPLRAILPLSAGMLDMPVGYFILSDIVSAIFWAPAYLLPGMLIGAATAELPPAAATRIIFSVFFGLILLWLTLWLLHKTAVFLLNRLDSALERVWLFCQRHPTLKNTAHCLHYDVAHGHRQLAFLLAIVVSFISLLILVCHPEWRGNQNSWNVNVFHLMQSLRFDLLDRIVLILTYFGEKQVIYFSVLITVGFLFWHRAIRAASFLILNTVLSSILIGAGKILIHSPRPTGFISIQSSNSFPSGHAGLFSAWLIFIAWLLGQDANKQTQKQLAQFVVVAVVCMGMTRLYLGDHWLVDVIAGISAGLLSAATCAFLYSMKATVKLPRPSTLMTICFSILFAASGFGVLHWHEDRIAHQWKFPTTKYNSDHWWQQTTPELPTIRTDRFGHPAANLNIQWLGEQQNIEHTLKKQGWRQVDPRSTFELIKSIFANDKTQVLSFPPELFSYREPDLLFTKQSAKQPLLILRLWQLPNTVTDTKTPLWIGSVDYRIIWKHRWWEKRKPIPTDLKNPIKFMANELPNWQIKEIPYQASQIIQHSLTPTRQQTLLLIKANRIPKSENPE